MTIPYIELTNNLLGDELKSRVIERLVPSSNPLDCWHFSRRPDSAGYYQIVFHSRRYLVHRLIYQMWFGVIPKHLEVDHLCNNKTCVSPLHLALATHRHNTMRAANHPYFIKQKKLLQLRQERDQAS